MGKLCNLRYLGLNETESLKFIAECLGKLTNLRTLHRFMVYDDQGKTRRGCNIRELKDLNKLNGEMSIEGLGGGRVKVIDAKKAQLKVKHELSGVKFYFGEQDNDRVDNASEERGLLEALEPPHGIERLGFCDYKGDGPAWYLDTNYGELQMLCLESCPSRLTVIRIKSLEELKVDYCPTLCELPSMPSLNSLKIFMCDGFSTIGDLPALKSLCMNYCGRLKTLANMPALESLDVRDCNCLEQVADDHMPAIKRT
uniref:R13L1/DRL21-like LRR repeat region domain-containing protein n=1 Tax=Nymphaea colorata TaxID=210225 RepID=A0A5K1H868_9MAGN|nr:unnamed protein product [Nymphaea colorata]